MNFEELKSALLEKTGVPLEQIQAEAEAWRRDNLPKATWIAKEYRPYRGISIEDAYGVVRGWDADPSKAPPEYRAVFGIRTGGFDPNVYRDAGVPDAIVDQLAFFRAPDDLREYRKRLDTEPRNARVYGIGSDIWAAWLCDVKGARYADVPELVMSMDAADSETDGRGSAEVVRPLRKVRLLCLGSFDRPHMTSYHVSMLSSLVHQRVNAGLPTVMATTSPDGGWDALGSSLKTEAARRQLDMMRQELAQGACMFQTGVF